MAERKLTRARRFRRQPGAKPAGKPIDVDDKDFLDMMMAEVNEEDAAEVLGEPAKLTWTEGQDPQKPEEKE